jgi:hypothetical protein
LLSVELAGVDVLATSGLPILAELLFADAGLISEFSVVVCKTETLPVTAGNDNNNPVSMNNPATVMVIFDKTDWVPRGPKAVLEILLVKSAPASVLPGCKSTETTKTKHEIKNNP